MISITLVGLEETLGKLRDYPAVMRDVITQALYDEAMKLQRQVKALHLSGPTSPAGSEPGVLGVRTDALRTSINIQHGEEGSTIWASVGTNVWYGKIHEYGATIPERTFKLTTTMTKFGNVRKLPDKIRKYVIPERSFLRSSLAERTPAIQEALKAAVARAAKEVLK